MSMYEINLFKLYYVIGTYVFIIDSEKESLKNTT